MKALVKIVVAFCLFSLSLSLQANPVDLNTAREVGVKFMSVNAKVSLRNMDDLQLATTYRTAENQVAFYVFNVDNGFVMVSADDCATPILGYSDEGQFVSDDLPIQLEAYLQHFVEQIQYGIENHLEADEEIARQWALVKATGRINDQRDGGAIAPLVKAFWDQGCYYNALCPATSDGPCGHAYTGCVATAMAQVMHYWGYPATGNGSHSYTPSNHPEYGQQTANFGATTYQWNNMPNSLTSNATAVATLMFHCGVSVNMNYGGDSDAGSSASSANIPNALMSYFRYSNDCSYVSKSNYTNSAWFALMKSCLDQGRPLCYRGYSDDSGGHAFVCDAYNESNQLHFNWGWSGSNNGFYALDALTPGSYVFSYNNQAVLNIHPPVNSSITYQVTAAASPTSGGTVTGAGSYSCYQVCTLTATPAANFSFIGWKEGETMVSTNATYSFSVKQNRSLTAVFGLSPVSSVSVSYYPDANDPSSSSVQVSWESPVSQTWSFDEGLDGWTLIDADGDGHNWYHSSQSNSTHGVTATASHSGEGHLMGESYCNSTSTALYPDDYLVSPQKQNIGNGTTVRLWACAQDTNYPSEHFGIAVSSTGNTSAAAFTMVQEWTLTAKGDQPGFPAMGRDGKTARNAGAWHEYTCDLSAYAGQELWIAVRHFNVSDQFIICLDDVSIGSGNAPYPAQTSFTEDFETGIPSDWTLIDADGDGHYWEMAGYLGHNGSTCISSASFINNVGALNPNNYLVSSQVALGGVFTFWACAQDASWAAEHFGVAVSTAGNTSASAFTMVQEWTLTSKGEPSNSTRGTRDQGSWHQYTVDLSSYAGQTGYIAIRHFNCTDMFYINVDDIQYGFGKETPQIQYYRIYRSTCGNTNTVMVADQQTGSSYIDNTWGSLPLGSYKFGVCSVGGANNESDIVWSNCLDKGVGHTITATANPTQGGTITGAGLYEQGTLCNLVATPNTGYTFVNWTQNGSVVSTNASYSFTVTGDAAFVANFSPNSYPITVTANPSEGGTVGGAGTYTHGTTAVLTATASEGYSFTVWTKNGATVSTNATYSFTVTGAGDYVANFSLNSYTVTASANPTQAGTVTGAGTYTHGASATLTATENTGYTFANWTSNGTVVSTNTSYTFTVTASGAYVANFNANSYQITVAADPEEGGVVDGGGAYDYGETCTLTAQSSTGYHFVNWTLDGTPVSSDPVYTFTVTGDANYTAHFSEEVYYTIIATANPEEGGTVTGFGTYTEGATCTLTATVNPGYSFVNWTSDGTVVSTNAAYTFTVTASGSYVANFEAITHVVTVAVDPLAGGTVVGEGTYQHGSMATIEVTPNPHYTFENWTLNGTVVSEELSYSFEVTEDCELVAHLYFYDSNGEVDISVLLVYPNPYHDKLLLSGLSMKTVEVYNAMGQRVIAQECDGADKVELNLGNVTPGLYTVSVRTTDGMKVCRSIVKE